MYWQTKTIDTDLFIAFVLPKATQNVVCLVIQCEEKVSNTLCLFGRHLVIKSYRAEGDDKRNTQKEKNK